MSNRDHMTMAEQVYFLGLQAAHVVARDEHERLERIDRRTRMHMRVMARGGRRSSVR